MMDVAALHVVPDHVHLHLFVERDPESLASYAANQCMGVPSRVLRGEFSHRWFLVSRSPSLS